jgi:hypothetical protein
MFNVSYINVLIPGPLHIFRTILGDSDGNYTISVSNCLPYCIQKNVFRELR